MAEMFSLSGPRAADALRLADRPGHLEDRPPLGGGPDRSLPDRGTALLHRPGHVAWWRQAGLMATESRPHWRIDDVLSRTRLDEILDELTGPAERNGPGRRWHCPASDHDDHRASVTMYTDRHGHERWRCWSGDHRGDAIDLAVLRQAAADSTPSTGWRRAPACSPIGRCHPSPRSRARQPWRRRWTRRSNGTPDLRRRAGGSAGA